LINNGGGIFRILPGHEETPVLILILKPHIVLTAQHLARMYGFDYSTASDETSLTQGLKNMYDQNEKPVILEVFTLHLKMMPYYYSF
jgi:2-succinyl-5-enolpyruvyl-6-hydroxy-3-cyclohexene-1-carboxylate synthase